MSARPRGVCRDDRDILQQFLRPAAEELGLYYPVEKAGQRRRRYYRLTAAGRKVLARQRSVWHHFLLAVDRVAGVTPVLR